MSQSTNALLNLCTAPTSVADDAAFRADTSPPSAATSQASAATSRYADHTYVCTGYQASPGEPHRKLLRSPLPSSGFAIERLNKEALPKSVI